MFKVKTQGKRQSQGHGQRLDYGQGHGQGLTMGYGLTGAAETRTGVESGLRKGERTGGSGMDKDNVRDRDRSMDWDRGKNNDIDIGMAETTFRTGVRIGVGQG